MKGIRDWRFCAFCGHRRRVYIKRHIGLLDIVICAFLGLLSLTPFADGIDPRGLALGAVLCGLGECFVLIRHRLSLKCSKCGFDPIVYRRSPEDAARMVRSHVEARALDPRALLAEPVRPVKRRSLRRADVTQQP